MAKITFQKNKMSKNPSMLMGTLLTHAGNECTIFMVVAINSNEHFIVNLANGNRWDVSLESHPGQLVNFEYFNGDVALSN